MWVHPEYARRSAKKVILTEAQGGLHVLKRKAQRPRSIDGAYQESGERVRGALGSRQNLASGKPRRSTLKVRVRHPESIKASISVN